MVPPRRRELVKSRRRVADDEEEEAGSETAPLEDDSLSEASLSDLDDEDADPDGSDISEQDETEARDDPPKQETPAVAGHAHTVNGTATRRPAVVSSQPKFAPVLARGDTHAMMNGLDVPARSDDADEIEFDDLDGDGVVLKAQLAKADVGKPSGPQRPEPQPDRKRQAQDDHRQKRDADPTFVPNRGGFFMHDHRHPGRAANGFRPFGKGRGRGRGAGGRQSPTSKWEDQLLTPNGHAPELTSGPWSHDLHETVAQDKDLAPHQNPSRANGASSGNGPRPQAPSNKTAAPIRSFSKSTHIGNTQIRVFLPDMEEPITFPAVPVRRHTRLPQHRPPLRRDKPVRVSLPGSAPRYIFPTIERSFIFIPRALRPNHQGHHGRPGGPGARGARGGFGPSRRTSSSRPSSVYAWSAHSASAPISRRSSLAQEMSVGRDYATSGATSTASRPPGAPADLSRPIVRLPPATDPSRRISHLPDRSRSSMASQPPLPKAASLAVQQQQQQQHHNHHHHYHQHQQYQQPPPPLPPPLDAQPSTYQENRPASLPMHQPRPQKTVSVAGIDSPEKVSFPRPPQQLQLPFHQQMPQDLNGNNAYAANPSQSHPHSRDPSFPSQPSTGSPLSHIPERAIHAQPFQPQSMPTIQPAAYASGYPAAAPQPVIYYPSSDPRAAPFGAPPTSSAPPGPMYLPGQAPGGPPSGTVAQESNGMVYYYDAAQVFGATAGAYPPGAFAVAPTGGVIGTGGMMTPAPDGYYYPHVGPGTLFYGP